MVIKRMFQPPTVTVRKYGIRVRIEIFQIFQFSEQAWLPYFRSQNHEKSQGLLFLLSIRVDQISKKREFSYKTKSPELYTHVQNDFP